MYPPGIEERKRDIIRSAIRSLLKSQNYKMNSSLRFLSPFRVLIKHKVKELKRDLNRCKVQGTRSARRMLLINSDTARSRRRVVVAFSRGSTRIYTRAPTHREIEYIIRR